MTQPKRSPLLAISAVPLLAAVLVVIGASSASAATTITGSAFGFGTSNIHVFGGAQNPVGPTPTVSLASNASNSPQSASAATGIVQYGPATLFTSDAISLQTSGSATKVTSTASVNNTNKATTQSSTGSEQLTTNTISSICSSTSSGNTGSTTVTSGSVVTDNGPTPPKTVPVPANPAPNTTISGVVHPSPSSSDNFHIVFNEQSTSNGVLTVNAADEFYDGPTLTGNLIIGQVKCGLTGSAASGTSLGPGSSVPAPATGSGGAWMIGAPLAMLGGGLLIGSALVVRRRSRARDLRKRD